MEGQHCKSCGTTKPSEEFIHPTSGKQGKTCSACIMKKSQAARKVAPVDVPAVLETHAAATQPLLVLEATGDEGDRGARNFPPAWRAPRWRRIGPSSGTACD